MRHQLVSANNALPKVAMKLPRTGAGASNNHKFGKPKKKSCIRIILETILFLVWLFVTGMGGYFLGHLPVEQNCPPPRQPEVITVKNDCIHEELGAGEAIGAASKVEGFTLSELIRQWKCSHASSNFTQANQRIYPNDKSLDKSKWKSILSVEPKRFFDKYLTQYPGDVRAVQPVVVFSHKELNSFDEISDVCKVVDVAIVPDTPGVCVAVTETFHDVASYHMLHADRQRDGTYALTANSIEGRDLPDEKAYAGARALLLEYFSNVDRVEKYVKGCPKYNQNKVTVGAIIEDEDEMELFKNSLQSAYAAGINKNKFCMFTTNPAVNSGMKSSGIKVIYIPELQNVGTKGDADVGVNARRYFLQAWLSFACANSLIKMMWQSPGTVWLDRPDNVVNTSPIVEGIWAFKGRNDKRAAPFYVSYDFFSPTGHERPVHLCHEILLHFDLVLAWGSLDAVASYRLSENNARYGTTTYILPPYRVLHTELMANDPAKIIGALTAPPADRPMVIVFPRENVAPATTKALLKQCNLWLLTS